MPWKLLKTGERRSGPQAGNPYVLWRPLVCGSLAVVHPRSPEPGLAAQILGQLRMVPRPTEAGRKHAHGLRSHNEEAVACCCESFHASGHITPCYLLAIAQLPACTMRSSSLWTRRLSEGLAASSRAYKGVGATSRWLCCQESSSTTGKAVPLEARTGLQNIVSCLPEGAVGRGAEDEGWGHGCSIRCVVGFVVCLSGPHIDGAGIEGGLVVSLVGLSVG